MIVLCFLDSCKLVNEHDCNSLNIEGAVKLIKMEISLYLPLYLSSQIFPEELPNDFAHVLQHCLFVSSHPVDCEVLGDTAHDRDGPARVQ